MLPVERRTAYYAPEKPRPVEMVVRPLDPSSLSPDAPLHLPVPGAATDTDWVAILLAIVALIALLGLIPLWYLAYRAWLPLG
jgi:hypothetical protein